MLRVVHPKYFFFVFGQNFLCLFFHDSALKSTYNFKFSPLYDQPLNVNCNLYAILFHPQIQKRLTQCNYCSILQYHYIIYSSTHQSLIPARCLTLPRITGIHHGVRGKTKFKLYFFLWFYLYLDRGSAFNFPVPPPS